MTGMLTNRAKAERETRLSNVIKKLAHEVPALADLDEETLRKVAQAALADDLKDQMKTAVKLERIDWEKETQTFLSVKRRNSEHTARAYVKALTLLEAWCKAEGISPLELDPARADDWITSMRAHRGESGRPYSAASVRVWSSATSAFWTWLERRHSELRNPFRGTRARPKREQNEKKVPTQEEIDVMLAEAKPELRAEITVMARLGLRVGGLPSFSINGNRWTAKTKGKDQRGKVLDEVRKAITKAELSLRSPFASSTSGALAKAFEYHVGKLQKAGKVSAAFSCHSLRHAFAVKFYTDSGHDIYATSKALGHADIGTTQTYLRSIGAMDE